MINYINLSISEQEYEQEISPLLKKIFLKGNFVGGEEIEEFENNFAKYIGCKYAISTASGTDALILALKALDIGVGDEVITVPNSFIATANAIEWIGAKAVFVDIGEDLLIDVKKIEKAITKKTKAIMPVHLTGLACDMDEINDIAKEYNLRVIEDAAQSIGSKYKGKKTGSLGDVGCFSLHPLKNLGGIGDGGIITTNNQDIAERLRLLKNNGLITRDEQQIIGRVSRLDTLNAIVLNHRLKKVDSVIERKRASAKKYHELLADIEGVELIKEAADKFHSYHTFVIKAEKRDDLKRYLFEKGIETKIHYPILIHQQKTFQDRGFKLPNSERLNKKILTLPLNITEEEIEVVAGEIKGFYRVSS
nr:DegT/DnrJ/EryC1/StrS family aminotransferase [Hippea jasoniae]